MLWREPRLGAGQPWANGRTSLSLAFLIFHTRAFTTLRGAEGITDRVFRALGMWRDLGVPRLSE